MLPFKVWRSVFRIPWLRENARAVRFLSDLFYLLLVLYRARRLHDFNELKCVYFGMIDSFAQYGRSEAKDTIDRVLQISWFRDHKGDVYRMITAYNRVMECMRYEEEHGVANANIDSMNRAMAVFIEAFKALINFDTRDEARVEDLRAQPHVIDYLIRRIRCSLESRTSNTGYST